MLVKTSYEVLALSYQYKFHKKPAQGSFAMGGTLTSYETSRKSAWLPAGIREDRTPL